MREGECGREGCCSICSVAPNLPSPFKNEGRHELRLPSQNAWLLRDKAKEAKE